MTSLSGLVFCGCTGECCLLASLFGIVFDPVEALWVFTF